MSEYASRGRSLESSHAPRSSSVNEAHAPRTRTAAEQAHDVVTAFDREVKAIGGAIVALAAARDANDPQRWQELRTAADRQIAVADHSLQRATTYAGHAAPEVQAQLVAAERVLTGHKANAQEMREPPLGFRPVAGEGAILDVLSAPVEGSAQVGYAHKESALKAQFDQLSVADSRALVERLRTGRPNDPVASAFGRMTTERRGRLLAFLDDARRREAVRIARGPKVPGANPSSRPETTARPAAVTTIDPEIAVRGVDGATETAALDRNAGPQKLPDSVRSDLEAATGTSLDHVRVHADAHGHAVAASHGARAVAIGSDIYMGKGELDVNSPRGRELLAHEVAHVVQAKANPGHAAMKRDGESSIDAAEHDADTFATAFQRHGRAALWTPKVGVSGSTAMRKPLGESVRSRDAFNAKLDNQLSIAERTGVIVSAPAFMHLHMPEIRRAAHLFLAARTISSGDPQVELRDGFFDALFEAFDGNDTAASVTRLRNWVAPSDLYAIVDRNRAIFDGRDKPQAGHANAALDYKHGPKGPPHWAPAVGVAIGSAIEPHLIQSLARMSPRLVAITARKREAAKASGGEPASVQPSELVSAHPLDWHVALAMVGRTTPGVEVKAGPLTVAADGRVAYRKIKQIEWQGAHGGAWNSLRVVDPPDANLEEVATHLLGKSTEGYRIQRVGSFYIVPVEDAARLPEAVRHRNTAPAGVAPLAFGKLAGNVETAEIERAMARDANRPQSATPTAAALEVQWQQIQEQLLGIAIVIRSSGLDIAMTSALARHGMHKVDLAGLSGRDALVRGELFTRQHTLLVKIAAEIGSVASRGAKKGASTKSASENVVEQLVHAASLSHLAETGEAAFATAHASQRDTIVDTLEAMLGQVATQIEIARQTADHSRARSKGSARAFGTTLQDRADALRQRVAELRSELLHGVVDPAEVEALRAAIDALRFETGTVASVGQLGQLFDVLDKLESSNWVVFSEGLTAAIGETTSDNRIGRLETARRGSHELRSALQTIHSQWLKVQGAAVAFSDRLAVGGSKDASEQASSTMAPALDAIRARLTMLGGEAAIQAFLREAYDMVDNAETRAMIVQIASMIGIAVVSGGVAAMAEGVALGAGASVIGAQLAGLTVETVTFTLLSARLSGEPMLQAFASNFAGNLVTFGAMRATNAVVAGSAIGRTLAKAKAGERVAKLAAIAAKTAEITAPMLVAIGVQFAQAEAESLLREGRTLSMEELQIAGVQGIAMAIGAIVSHKVLGESMNDAKAFGADHAARRAQRKHIEKLAADVMQQGDPSQVLDLMREARAYVEAEIAKWQELSKLPENELESRGLSPKVVQTMGKAAKAHLAALDGAETGTMPAQIGLDTVVPGYVYAGDPHDVQQVLESYRARGYRVDQEPGGYRISKKNEAPIRILERTTPQGRVTPAAPPKFELKGQTRTLHFDPKAPQEWSQAVAAFLADELKVDPAKVEVKQLNSAADGEGRSGDPVFGVKLEGEDVGVFKLFRDRDSATNEIAMIESLRSKKMKSYRVVEARGLVDAEIGADARSGLLMETAQGTSINKQMRVAPTPGRPGHETAMIEMETNVRSVARATAEMHVAFASGSPESLAQKRADTHHLINKLPTVTKLLSADSARTLESKLVNEVVPAFVNSNVPATAYHGDANAANFMVGNNREVRVIDVGTMKWSIDPNGKGKGTGAADVGRFIQSLEASNTGTLTHAEVARLQQAFISEYFAATRFVASDHQAGILLYRVELEIAALTHAKSSSEINSAMQRLGGLLGLTLTGVGGQQ